MKGQNEIGGVAVEPHHVFAQDRRSYVRAQAGMLNQDHNARGLLLAVAMSAGCWAAIALALFL